MGKNTTLETQVQTLTTLKSRNCKRKRLIWLNGRAHEENEHDLRMGDSEEDETDAITTSETCIEALNPNTADDNTTKEDSLATMTYRRVPFRSMAKGRPK